MNLNLKTIINHGCLLEKLAIAIVKQNLQNTMNKARMNADVQPLFKDTGIIDKPTDTGTQVTARESSQALSHMEDKRIKSTSKKRL